ncbi:hypothetical protein QTP88_002889 [Uroleucon formosanum]
MSKKEQPICTSCNTVTTVKHLLTECLLTKDARDKLMLPNNLLTTATGERSFSTLRRLKTYLRNTTGQQRLNEMAALNIHTDIEVKPDLVLDEMAKHSKRRINLKL